MNVTRSVYRAALWLLAALMLAPTAVPAPAGARSEDEPVTLTTVRFVHAVPEGPALDVLIDGKAVAQGLQFGSATDYTVAAPGERQIEALVSGETAAEPFAVGAPDLDEGSSYIITFLGQVGETGVKVNEVELDALDPGKARVRIIHASPDAGELELAVAGGETLFDGVEFEEDSKYKVIDAGGYQIDGRAGDDGSSLTSLSLDVQAGRAFDLVAIGVVGTQSFTILPLVTAISPPCSEVLGTGTAADACVRVIHGQPELGDADAAVAGNVVAEGLPFGTATEFIAVPAGDDLAISLSPKGTAGGDGEPETVSLRAGQAYEIVAWSTPESDGTGEPADNTLIELVEVDLTPLPERQGRLRVIQAAGDVGEIDIVMPPLGDDAKLFEGVGEGDATSYEVIDEGAYPLEVHYKGEDAAFFAVELEVKTGVVYDVIAIGRTEDASFMVLVLTAPAQIRSDTATPAADSPGATPAVMDATPVAT